MQYQYQNGNPGSISHGTARISALIAELKRTFIILDAHVEAEEQRIRNGNPSDLGYPALAKHLRTRQTNLNSTIVQLTKRLAASALNGAL